MNNAEEKPYSVMIAEQAMGAACYSVDELVAAARKATKPAPIANGENGLEYPADFLARLAENKLTKRDVQSVIHDFQLSISLHDLKERTRAIVVTDESDTAQMRAARELRLELKNERVRIEKLRKRIKEPHLRRVQVIDGVAKVLRDQFEEEESYLVKQENFAVLRAAERRHALLTARREQLQPFVESVEVFGDTLADMPEDAYRQLLETSRTAWEAKQREAREREEAERAEQERIRRENEELRKRQQRINSLAALGFVYDPVVEHYVFENLVATKHDLDGPEADWNARYAVLKTHAEAIREQRRAEAEREAAERAELERRERERQEEERRIADEKARIAAAPDREKLSAYFRAVSDVGRPELATPEAQSLLHRFVDDLAYLVNRAEAEAHGLRVVEATAVGGAPGPDVPF